MPENALAIIGAGPKALAIGAKACVLAELGFDVPEIHILERSEIGANWTGKGGYTNGRQPLGTSPEKDIGFPYDSTAWGAGAAHRINDAMQRFSWQSFLVHQGLYSSWVDRGRPAPEHRQWAAYLQWIADRIASRVHFHHGEVHRLRLLDGNWQIDFRSTSGDATCTAAGLVLTGPGLSSVPGSLAQHPSVMTVEHFWTVYPTFGQLEQARVAIVGAGETAAAVAMGLAQLGNDQLAIEIVSPLGMTYSRGESFRENRVYSDPASGQWSSLTWQHRRDFINRTDRGVFSPAANRQLDLVDNLDIVAGRMTGVRLDSNDKPILQMQYHGRTVERAYDVVVLATGADQLSFFNKLIDDPTRSSVLAATALEAFTQEHVEKLIGYDLAVRDLTPGLYLPMLSGMAQGPGFANLSCLGRLSDRILEGLVTPPAAVQIPETRASRVPPRTPTEQRSSTLPGGSAQGN